METGEESRGLAEGASMCSVTEKRNAAKSAARVVSILEMFGRHRSPLRAKTIISELELSPSSVDQILKTLVHSGHLLFDPVKKVYLPSLKLFPFAEWLVEESRRINRYKQLVDALQQQFPGVSSLSARSQHYMQVVYSTGGIYDGAQTPLDSVPGKALLAQCEDREAVHIIEQAALFRRLRVPPDQLISHVRMIRGRPFVGGPSLDEDLWSVCIALPRLPSGLQMILGVGGEREATRAKQWDIATAVNAEIETIGC